MRLCFVIVLAACKSSADPISDGPVGSGPDAPPAASCTPVAGNPAELVSTTSGVIHGAAEGSLLTYKRVPFAKPPIGERRWAAPAAPACAAEIDARSFGPQCPQLADGTFTGDEDCLHLNLWAPSSAGPRAVMVWIHGGGNAQGSAVDPIYDGRRLAETGDVVVVTINYRLGQLGFLAEPTLGEGNYGLLDQIAALDWVHDNIAAFGGDPARVTIFGESAGGRDVCALVSSPAAAGLFRGAIMQSGGCLGLPSRATAEATAVDYVEAAGCTGNADLPGCLRALDAEAAIRADAPTVSVLASQPYQPMIDGVVLPDQAQHVIEAGQHNQGLFMVGANADETAASAPPIPSAQAYSTAVHAQLPPALADAALQHYPAASFPTPRAAFVRLTTDLRFVCPSREIAKAVDAAQSAPVFRYLFAYRPSLVGATHGLDVPYLFGTFDALIINGQSYVPTATDLAVSAQFQERWTGFARDGVPGSDPAWPLYGTDATLVIDSTTTVVDGIRTADCDFWEPFYDSL